MLGLYRDTEKENGNYYEPALVNLNPDLRDMKAGRGALDAHLQGKDNRSLEFPTM